MSHKELDRLETLQAVVGKPIKFAQATLPAFMADYNTRFACAPQSPVGL